MRSHEGIHLTEETRQGIINVRRAQTFEGKFKKLITLLKEAGDTADSVHCNALFVGDSRALRSRYILCVLIFQSSSISKYHKIHLPTPAFQYSFNMVKGRVS